jgi:hypothetical protein
VHDGDLACRSSKTHKAQLEPEERGLRKAHRGGGLGTVQAGWSGHRPDCIKSDSDKSGALQPSGGHVRPVVIKIEVTGCGGHRFRQNVKRHAGL